MSQFSKIFQSGQLGDIQVKNRVFMAPLTRNRAQSDGTPKDMAIEYYKQRASAGLIVSEATQIDPMAKGYLDTPGIHNGDQAAVWQKITDAVHKKGGKMYCQLWHVGRISHTSLLPNGQVPLAPSAIAAKTQTFTAKGFQDVSMPRSISVSEIKEIVDQYVSAAKLAMTSGFDGVEVHSANGYLLNQFIATNSNLRTDEYGGSVENRARFLLEVIDAVTANLGAGRVGVRLSPTGKFNDVNDTQVKENYTYIFSELAKRKLSYLHVVESFPGSQSTTEEENLVKSLRASFNGNYIANGGYDGEQAEKVISEGAFAVAFGRPFISNPDLPERLKQGVALTEADQSTFYGGDEKGYTDYVRKT